MPKGDNLRGKKTGNNFALNPQPSGEAKSRGRQRKGYLVEFDPKYCDVIVARMIKLDSTLQVKRNGVLLTNSEVLKFTENTSESK